MKYEVVVLNSKGGAGKDTFFGFCEAILGDCTAHISTVDLVKEVAESIGWDGTKTLENRRRLSMLKDIMTAWGDGPFKDVCNTINQIKYEWLNGGEEFGIIFVDCREPYEIERLVEKLGAKTLLITRDNLPTTYGNHADDGVFDYTYDYIVENNGSLTELRDSARAIIDTIRAEE